MSETRITEESPAGAKSYNKARRVAVSAVCIVTSLLGILGSLTFIVGGFDVFASEEQEIKLFLVAIISSLLVFWCSFFVMVWGWTGNRALHKVWPVINAISGVSSLYLAGFLSLVALTAILLAIYLIYFHLTRGSSRSQQVPSPSFARYMNNLTT